MTRIYLALLVMFLAATGLMLLSRGTLATEYPLEFTDDLGARIHLDARPKRIASLSPALTEIIWMLGAGNAMVGRSDFCNFPEEVKELPSVGGIINPSVEAILLLDPDIVFVQEGSPRDVVSRLKELDVQVVGFKTPETLLGILFQIEVLGDILDREIEAGEFTAQKKHLLENLRKERSGSEWRVYFGGVEPPYFTAGNDTFINDLITLAGGMNIATLRGTFDGWRGLSPEEIILRDPEVILVGHSRYEGGDDVLAKFLVAARKNEVFSGTSAVRAGSVCLIEADVLLRPGPRVFDALTQFSDFLGELEIKEGE